VWLYRMISSRWWNLILTRFFKTSINWNQKYLRQDNKVIIIYPPPFNFDLPKLAWLWYQHFYTSHLRKITPPPPRVYKVAGTLIFFPTRRGTLIFSPNPNLAPRPLNIPAVPQKSLPFLNQYISGPLYRSEIVQY